MQLNREQIKVVRSPKSWKRLLACAGSGKTTVLVHRLNYLMAQGIPGQRILLITFTRKAAGELKSRIKSKNKEMNRETSPWIGTFHGLAYFLMRSYKLIQGYSVLHEEEEINARTDIISKRDENLRHIPLRSFLNKVDLSTIEPDSYGIYTEFFQKIEHQYKHWKEKNRKIDYDDFFEIVLKFWEREPQKRKKFSDQFDAILIDEFQDTNPEQIKFLQSFLKQEHDFLAVGDDWQSIYGFRNADMTVLTRFQRSFPGSKTYKLVNNYRSTAKIIILLNRLLDLNQEKVKKKMIARKERGSSPEFFFFASRTLMFQWIEENAEILFPYKDVVSGETMAILCRTNFLCEQINGILKESYTELDLEDSNLSIITIHQSKGLEFDRVLVAGLEENYFPHRDNGIEEERRLLFVAASRARKKLLFALVGRMTDVEKNFSRELGTGFLY